MKYVFELPPAARAADANFPSPREVSSQLLTRVILFGIEACRQARYRRGRPEGFTDISMDLFGSQDPDARSRSPWDLKATPAIEIQASIKQIDPPGGGKGLGRTRRLSALYRAP